MTELHQKFLLLRPMRTGVSGFARIQWERGQAWVQLNVRGAPGEGVRAFWYSSGGEARELGTCAANARGEASLEGSVPGGLYAPERLQALIVVENNVAPRPLLIGLCTETSAGSLLDAKNASLSLCDKLARAAVKRRQPGRTETDGRSRPAQGNIIGESHANSRPSAGFRAQCALQARVRPNPSAGKIPSAGNFSPSAGPRALRAGHGAAYESRAVSPAGQRCADFRRTSPAAGADQRKKAVPRGRTRGTASQSGMAESVSIASGVFCQMPAGHALRLAGLAVRAGVPAGGRAVDRSSDQRQPGLSSSLRHAGRTAPG